MKILNSGDTYTPKSNEKVIFLAGPTKRREKTSKDITDWRKQALTYFKQHENNRSLVIVIPEPFIEDQNVNSQIAWEDYWLGKADRILFWVARDHSKKMHATVTNLEFGLHLADGPSKIAYGRPEGADSASSSDFYAKKYGIEEIFDNLLELVNYSISH